MSGGGSGPRGTVHPRRWILLAVVSVLFSVILSLAYLDGATHPGPGLYKTTSDQILALWVVAITAGGIAVLSVWRLLRRRPNAGRQASRVMGIVACGIIVAAVIGPAGLAASAVSSNAPHNEQLRQVMLTAVRLCHEGAGIEAAQAYGGASHPIEIVVSTGDGSVAEEQADVSIRAASAASLPDRIEGVQLVACIGQSVRVTLQTCSYTKGGTYTRYAFTRDVSVYEARTRTLLDRQTYAGGAPDACPEVKAVGEDQDEGGQIGWDDSRIWDDLATWTSGPVRTAAPGID